MGCGTSRPEQNDKIKTEMKTTKVKKFDEFFESASSLLQRGETVRKGLQDTQIQMHRISKTHNLALAPKLIDAIQGFLWALSANFGGKIETSGCAITLETPFVKTDTEDLRDELKDFKENLRLFIATCMESSPEMKKILTSGQEMTKTLNDLSINAKEEAQNSGLGPMDVVKAISALSINTNVFTAGITRITILSNTLSSTTIKLKELIKKINDSYKDADANGEKALNGGHLTPELCLLNYHPGRKKSEEQTADTKKNNQKN